MEMKTLLILIVGLIAKSSAQTASCQYFESQGIGYACYLSMNNPLGAEFENIEGEHLEGRTNADVVLVYSWDGSTTNVPQRICTQFPNVRQIDLSFFGITTITEQSFSGCANANSIRMWFNQITDIPVNAFANNPLLNYLDLDSNNLTTLPENVFQNLNNLTVLEIRNNPFDSIPAGVFNGLTNLQTLYMSNVRITEINPAWFANTPNLLALFLYNNLLTSINSDSFSTLTNLMNLDIGINPLRTPIPANAFAQLTNLIYLYMDNLQIAEVNSSWFSGLSNLIVLALYSNLITALPENTFAGLSNLWVLDLGYNRQMADLPPGIFNGLTALNSLYLNTMSLTSVREEWFRQTPALEYLFFNFNQIEDLPPRAFATLNNLVYLGLWSNRVKTIERGYFGDLNRLYYLDLDENNVNGLDQRVFDDATQLSVFYFWNNVCASGSFFDFNANRAQNFQRLNRCFRNFLFTVETVTEGDDFYRFYGFPQPGIYFRVEAAQDVHISLNPVNFEATPRMEIHIGAANNTRSIIRRNGTENVVDISTPGILRASGPNGFRVIFANWAIMVVREGDQWPFMGFNMRDFYPVHFYGIRTPGTLAPWSILPLEADGS